MLRLRLALRRIALVVLQPKLWPIYRVRKKTRKRLIKLRVNLIKQRLNKKVRLRGTLKISERRQASVVRIGARKKRRTKDLTRREQRMQ